MSALESESHKSNKRKYFLQKSKSDAIDLFRIYKDEEIEKRLIRGLKKYFYQENLSENKASEIIRNGFDVTGKLLNSDDEGASVCGLFLMLGLKACWDKGGEKKEEEAS